MESTVQSALVIIVAYLLKLAADALGIPLDEATLTALAVAIVAYLLGTAGGREAVKRLQK